MVEWVGCAGKGGMTGGSQGLTSAADGEDVHGDKKTQGRKVHSEVKVIKSCTLEF